MAPPSTVFSLLLLAACASPDAAEVALLGDLVHIDALGPPCFTAVTTDSGGVVVGTDHGLYRRSAADGELVLLGGPTLVGRFVTALTTFDGAIFVASVDRADSRSGEMLRSADGGETWADASAGLGTMASGQFASEGGRLVFAGDAVASEWEPATATWMRVDDAETPVAADRAGFVGGRLLVNDAYGTGVYEEDPDSGRFAHVESLSEWGYTAFAQGDVGVTANGGAIFLSGGDGWEVAYEEPGALGVASDLFATGGVVLAAGVATLRRTTDGAAWTELDVATSSDEAFAGDAAELWWIADDALRGSTDAGATWAIHPADLAIADRVHVGGGVVYAVPQIEVGALAYSVRAAEGEGFAAVAADVDDLAVTATDLWTCADGACRRAPHDGAATFTLAAPEASFVADRLHATATDVYFDAPVDGCDGGVPLRLWRFEDGAWAAIGEGLPSVGDGDCESPRYADRDLWITAWSEADGVVFADVAHAGTYRSDDRGARWAPVDVRILSAAACGGAILALTDAGALVRSVDGGETFAPASAVEGAVALATVGDTCVLGVAAYDGGPTLLSSADGATFEALAFTEPVAGLAADDATLAVSTASRGVYRAEIALTAR